MSGDGLTNSELTLLLEGSPFERSSNTGKPNAVRFYRGSSTAGDVAAGLAVDRELIGEGKRITFHELCAELVAESSRQFFLLRAATGEGKSTLMFQIALALEGIGALVLWWRSLEAFEPQFLSDIARTSGRIVVLLAEFEPIDHDEKIARAAKLLRAAQEHCSIFVAGSPADLASFRRTGAKVVEFAPLSTEARRSLTAKLSAIVASSKDDRTLDDAMPNLRAFASAPDEMVFEGVPLIVGLLRATYGYDFHDRLREEFERTEGTQKAWYKFICLFDAVRVPLEEDFVRRLVPNEELTTVIDDGAPWLTTHTRHTAYVRARHPVVAQTVMIECKLMGGRLDTLLSQVLNVAGHNEHGQTVRLLFSGYSNWTSVRIEPASDFETHIAGIARKAVRTAIRDHQDWFATYRRHLRTQPELGGERVAEAMDWARLIHTSLPQSAGGPPSPDKQFFAKEATDWLELAKISCPKEMLPRLRYLQIKAELAALPTETEEWSKIARTRVLELATIASNHASLLDCHADVAAIAVRLAKDSSDPDEKVALGEIAVRSYARMLASPSHNSLQPTRMLLDGILHHLVRQSAVRDSNRLTRVLDAGWSVSVEEGKPDAFLGTWLAERLYDASREDEADRVLRKLLAHTPWGDALLALVTNSAEDGALHYVTEYVALNYQHPELRGPVDVALAFHAAGIALKQSDRAASCARLVFACEHYDRALAGVPSLWHSRGENQWSQALADLLLLNCESYEALRQQWVLRKAACAAENATK